MAFGYPLVVRQNALVTKVLFDAEPDADGRRVAKGVAVLEGSHLYRADPLVDADPNAGEPREFFATREVILSAGAFNTPQLLKLSGIGPASELEPLGIEVLVDLPGVGTNLQDRYEVGVVGELPSDLSAIEDCTFGVMPDPCIDDWMRGEGVYTSNGAVAGVVMKSVDTLTEPDLFVFGLPGNFKGYEPGYGDIVFGDKRHFTWAVLKAHTGNTAGTVTLRSADPRDVPDIRFRYFHEGSTDQGQDQSDLQAMVAGVDFARLVGANTDDLFLFSSYDEVWPGAAVQGTGVEQWVKDEAWGHHASCTCPIGADDDPMAVLDSRFRVRGTTGLRVVDASVFPKIPGFFIVVPIYMVSEKATDVLLADIGEERRV
jgi:choline dehydrogenase